ncbi:envelope glycoprotein C [Psittacid alphaherpesvirus 5]|uniref:Envelope glycoprotein C n=1 Tax=Psittacid alphaherpesvirus 5 TaxID=2972693 RepID=A0A5P9JSP7_9ALPH|nr:envelope glycoprotein C [Psittacid alphaherpesvirus 5]QFU14580.1 envelope glycoprotein C [Psittacid alphaherpesvirus 5]UOO01051.1 envelope glycoprotein C [Psittacid alphaherpesvirus 5]
MTPFDRINISRISAQDSENYTLVCTTAVVYARIGEPLAISCSSRPALTGNTKLIVSLHAEQNESLPLPAFFDVWSVWDRPLYTYNATLQRFEMFIYGSGDGGFVVTPEFISPRGPFPIFIRYASRSHAAIYKWTIFVDEHVVATANVTVRLAAKPQMFFIDSEDALKDTRNRTYFPAKVSVRVLEAYPISTANIRWVLSNKVSRVHVRDLDISTYVKHILADRGTFDTHYSLVINSFPKQHRHVHILVEYTWIPPAGFETLFRPTRITLQTDVVFVDVPTLQIKLLPGGTLSCSATNILPSIGHLVWTQNNVPIEDTITFARDDKASDTLTSLTSFARVQPSYALSETKIEYICRVRGYSPRFPDFYARIEIANDFKSRAFPIVCLMILIIVLTVMYCIMLLCVRCCVKTQYASY